MNPRMHIRFTSLHQRAFRILCPPAIDFIRCERIESTEGLIAVLPSATSTLLPQNHMKAQKLLVVAALLSVGATDRMHAASGTWTSSSNGNWVTAGNWSASPVPGTTSGNGNADAATFNTATGVTVTVDSHRALTTVNYDTNAGSFTLNSGGLFLASGGSINLLSTITSSGQTETINTPVTTNGSMGVNNNATTSDIISLTGTITNTKTSGTAVVSLGGTNVGANTISGVISNGGTALTQINKTGAGTWNLSGANTYTATTAISGGRLNINNTTGSGTGTGSVTVASGSTLGGNGTINPTATNKVTVSSGGIFAPGTVGNTDTLTISATGNTNPSGLLALSGATLAFNLGAANTSSKLSLTSAFANEVTGLSGNTFNFTDLTAGSLSTGRYTLFLSDTSGSNPFSGLGLGVLSGFTINGLSSYTTAGDIVQLELNQLGGSNFYALQLNIQAVPEPGTWAMLVGGLVLLVGCHRRFRQS